MQLSIVTSLYNSAPFIQEFHRRISAEAQKVASEYEIVIVDDGSPDAGIDIAQQLVKDDPHVRVIELSRNFGHHKALMTGLAYATGNLIFLIDVDLEEQPELLGQFVEEQKAGDWDVVYGYQEKRVGGSVVKDLSDKLGWYFITKLYSVSVPLNQCTVRLMRRDYVNSLVLHKEHNTVIGALWVITGYRQHGVPIHKLYNRQKNTAAYTALTRMRVLIDGVTSFSSVPLIFISLLGVAVSAVAFLMALYVVLRKIFFNAAVGWASTVASIWFLGGLIIFCIGIVGIYISRIFIETKQRPYTLVRRIYAQETAPTIKSSHV
jgi:putative glycosyltransferase